MAIDDGGPATRVARQCSTCRYFDRIADECRRWPPMVMVLSRDGDDQIETVYPTVSKDAWCGEWKAAHDAR